MARKKIGHVELQWTCPNCGGINPGPVKTCQSCGSPQPEDVQFEQAERQELIEDEEKIAQAEAGADIYCPYCGTRNPADATTCSQCGGDLVGGAKRESGRVVGAFKSGPVKLIPCPRCGADNPDTAKTCSQCGSPMRLDEPDTSTVVPGKPASPSSSRRWILIGAVIAIVALCAVLFFVFFSTNETTGTVQSVNWERSIPIEVFGPVNYSAFIDEIPSGAAVISCQEQYHHTQDEPAANAVEVCGTPYTVDEGSGYAEVVEDCVYEVSEDFCKYTVEEWYVGDTTVLTGSNYNPVWPDPALTSNQRLGDARTASYVIVFQTEDGIERYTTSSLELFQQAEIGSIWTLEINQIGGVVSITR